MGFGRGAGYLLRGLRLWRERPALMLLGIVPAVIVAALVAALFVVLVLYVDDVVGWATPFADGWDETVRGLFRAALYVLVLAGAGMLAIVTYTGLTLAVGDPFYEKIWKEVELSLGGDVPDRGVGWVRGATDGLALVVLGLATAIGVFLIGLLPVVGTVVGAVLGLAVSGRLLAGELVSRPLEARGMDRAARAALMRRHRGAMLGFGVCVQACFLVPFGGILVMPAAVAGATYLAREALEPGAGLSPR
ncbi:EI24 domain-containing protein [Nocardioides daeguensis]|uniref:EI24 domain-containing protein n=1 Tax=Nocardioides daeguensis TaxID=908359 RepID=A0ABP6VPP4_9ACTN|nr:EI24 domain-containing protein [Nocardioides daeguensis]MBV6727377.1 EI24 domain-containing protein [Nocardioides daeguensis]MCR1775466.1 EI24 domain-containing protein [Nocardioides daeguensis]